MKLALFGGTFDPIHAGHIAVAECAWREEGLDRVLFVPARHSPLKTGQPCVSGSQRSEMIELAIQEHPWAGIWRGELDRPAPSYSWQTVAFFRNALPVAELYWILGADQWNTLPSWVRSEYLAQALTFLVFHRGESPRALSGFKMKTLPAMHPASSTAIRQGDWTYLDPLVADYIRRCGLYRPENPDFIPQPGHSNHCGSTERTGPVPGP